MGKILYTTEQDLILAGAGYQEIESIAKKWGKPYSTLERRARKLRAKERGGQPVTKNEAAGETPLSEMKDSDLVAQLEGRGYIAYKPEKAIQAVHYDTARIKGKRVKVGVISDSHFGNRYQQVTALTQFMHYAVKVEKVDCFIHAGDVTDGPLEMHKGLIHDQFLSTYDAQRDYAIANLPEVGKPIYIISGNHDESFLKNAGGDIVQDICSKRKDMTYLGRSQGVLQFGEVKILVEHPHDGGSYALSYKLQKRMEAFSSENKPHIYLLGNYHKAVWLPGYRNIHGFIVPSFEAQTPWMISKGIASIVGGLILEFGTDPKGIASSVKGEFVLEYSPKPQDFPHL